MHTLPHGHLRYHPHARIIQLLHARATHSRSAGCTITAAAYDSAAALIGSSHAAAAPPQETLFLALDEATEAVVTVTLHARGLGAVDPPTLRVPSAAELHSVSQLLSTRQYSFASTL